MNRKRVFFISMFSFAFGGLFLLLSCGLDTVWYLNEPTNRVNNENAVATSSSPPPIQTQFNYVEFVTANNSDDAANGGTYEGTAIYYKIYNNASTMLSHKSNLSNLISSTKSGNTSTTTLMDSYKYQPLAFFPNSISDPAVGASDSNRYSRVEIRLYTESESYFAHIKIGNNYIGRNNNYIFEETSGTWSTTSGTPVSAASVMADLVVPCRAGGSRNGFDFFDKNENARNNNSSNLQYGVKPESGDSDFERSSSSDSDDVYYIKLYAFSVGHDTSWTKQYSRALDLGEIWIGR